MIPKMKEFRRPVRIIFGDADPYLNKAVAQKFHELLPGSELFLVPGARHFVQMDEPETGGAANSGYAAYKERPGLTLVTKSPTEPQFLESSVLI